MPEWLFIDGLFIKSEYRALPFWVNKSFQWPACGGRKSIDAAGNIADAGIIISFGSQGGLELTDPAYSTVALFPITLARKKSTIIEFLLFEGEIEN